MKNSRMRHAIEASTVPARRPRQALGSYLSHSDRHVRYAARVAIEKLPVDSWREKALTEKQPVALPSKRSSPSPASAEPPSGITKVARARCQAQGHLQRTHSGTSRLDPANVELQNRMLRAWPSACHQSASRPRTRRPACLAAHPDPPRQTRCRSLRQDRRSPRSLSIPSRGSDDQSRTLPDPRRHRFSKQVVSKTLAAHGHCQGRLPRKSPPTPS
jgi:hypothetical protein